MVTAVGWDMYDPRLTVKAVLAEALGIGDCGFIHTDGLIYASDDNQSRCHGCALEAGAVDDMIVLVTHGRLRMVTAQTPGAPVYTQHAGAGVGSPPDDTDPGSHNPVGFAIEAYLIFVHVDGANATGGN